jgi:ABC-type transport system substrate-binding protein
MTWIDVNKLALVPTEGFTEWNQVYANRWQFKLREGVTFHNGEPWNAEAAAFSINSRATPARVSPVMVNTAR